MFVASEEKPLKLSYKSKATSPKYQPLGKNIKIFQ
jgi:hypothetical protein